MKDAAAEIGTAAHEWIHNHISGRHPEMPGPEAPHRRCVDAVLDFFLSHEVSFLETERPVYSKLYGYSGRMDAEAMVDGRFTLVDYKTGGVYWESRLQSAAYECARNEETGKSYDQRLILRLGKLDGRFETAFYPAADQPADLAAFLGLKTTFDRMVALERGCETCGEVGDRRKRCDECRKLLCKACLPCKDCIDPLGA